MKSTHKTGLLIGVSGIIMMIVNYIIGQYFFIFIGTVMIFVGIAIPIFLEDKTCNKNKNRRLSK